VHVQFAGIVCASCICPPDVDTELCSLLALLTSKWLVVQVTPYWWGRVGVSTVHCSFTFIQCLTPWMPKIFH